jgi:hypothetical protein
VKVKNVIKGLTQKFDIQEVNIISPNSVIYSGTLAGWSATSVEMILYKRKVENAEVVKHLLFNHREIFIFIEEDINYE